MSKRVGSGGAYLCYKTLDLKTKIIKIDNLLLYFQSTETITLLYKYSMIYSKNKKSGRFAPHLWGLGKRPRGAG